MCVRSWRCPCARVHKIIGAEFSLIILTVVVWEREKCVVVMMSSRWKGVNVCACVYEFCGQKWKVTYVSVNWMSVMSMPSVATLGCLRTAFIFSACSLGVCRARNAVSSEVFPTWMIFKKLWKGRRNNKGVMWAADGGRVHRFACTWCVHVCMCACARAWRAWVGCACVWTGGDD